MSTFQRRGTVKVYGTGNMPGTWGHRRAGFVRALSTWQGERLLVSMTRKPRTDFVTNICLIQDIDNIETIAFLQGG